MLSPNQAYRSPSPPEPPAILLVSTNADLAGAPIHVRELVLSLRDRFRFVVTFGEDGPVREFLAQAGVETLVIPGMRSAISPAADWRAVRRLRAQIRSIRPDLVHAHSSKAGLVARIAAQLERVPALYTIHGWGFGSGRPAVQSALVSISERFMRPLTHGFLAVSQADAEVGISQLGLSPSAVHVVPNGVPDTLRRAQPAKRGGFIMVARTDYPKDYCSALKSFSAVSTDLTFSAVGSGTDRTEFAAKASSWAGPTAASRLRLLGSRPDIADLLADSCVFVLCSRYEGMPISIIEAMRAGLPVIASRVGGVTELIEDGREGVLIERDDVSAMTRAMQQLADNPDTRQRMGQAARQRYETLFSIDRMRERVANVYYATIGQSAARAAST